MIRYALACAADHEFEGWFSASSDFDDQTARGLLSFCTKSARLLEPTPPSAASFDTLSANTS